jgi:hypothetical protein
MVQNIADNNPNKVIQLGAWLPFDISKQRLSNNIKKSHK